MHLPTPQTFWISLLSLDLHPITLDLVCTLASHLFFFWIPGFALHLLFPTLTISFPTKPVANSLPQSLEKNPPLLRLYLTISRISHPPPLKPRPAQPPFRLLLRTLLTNHLLLLPFHFSLLSFLPPAFNHSSSLPPFSNLVWHVPVSLLTTEFLFYHIHRLLHTYPFLYRNIHKHHHLYSHSTIGLSSQFAHPLEFLIANFLVVWLPLAAIAWLSKGGVHVTEWLFLYSAVLAESVLVHSGIDFRLSLTLFGIDIPGFLTTNRYDRGIIRRHDLHHQFSAGVLVRIPKCRMEGTRDSRYSGDINDQQSKEGDNERLNKMEGRRRTRWGNFGTFWWTDWLFGTEIVLSGAKGEGNASKAEAQGGDGEKECTLELDHICIPGES